MTPLSDIEIQRGLGGLSGWTRKGDTLVKSYHFATFPDGIAFIGRVAEIAESMAHHPDAGPALEEVVPRGTRERQHAPALIRPRQLS